MSTSKFLFKKVCVFCSRLFEAQKITTKYCSHACNLKHYKKKKRLQKIAVDEEQTKAQNLILTKPPDAVQSANAPREFLSVKQASNLLGCTKKTIYQLIKTKRLHAINLGHRKTIIKRIDLEDLFKKTEL
jgi:excisionase family DNA binding protein